MHVGVRKVLGLHVGNKAKTPIPNDKNKLKQKIRIRIRVKSIGEAWPCGNTICLCECA